MVYRDKRNGAPHRCAPRSATALSPRCSSKLGRGGRLIVRPSGTEPVIRVMGEGDDKILVEAVVDDVIEALSQVAA
jgi:phosphoglucosamine mutase